MNTMKPLDYPSSGDTHTKEEKLASLLITTRISLYPGFTAYEQKETSQPRVLLSAVASHRLRSNV